MKPCPRCNQPGGLIRCDTCHGPYVDPRIEEREMPINTNDYSTDDLFNMLHERLISEAGDSSNAFSTATLARALDQMHHDYATYNVAKKMGESEQS